MEKKLFQIFRAGTHTAMRGQELSFSESDLIATAYAYQFKTKRAPLVLGHPDNNLPEYGYVLELIAKAGKLFAFAEVSTSLLGLVREGRYKNVSAGFFGPSSPQNPVQGVWNLRHVGFLGANPPAVRGMDTLEFAGAEGWDMPAEFAAFSGPSSNDVLSKINEFRRVAPCLSYTEIVSLATR